MRGRFREAEDASVLNARVLVLVGASWSRAGAMQQAPVAKPAEAPPVSLTKIRDGVSRRPALNSDRQLAVAIFKTRTQARVLMVPFEERLRQELEPTLRQRQSRDWESRCCGLDLGLLFDPIDKALERRKTRRVRERIARELAELEASKKKRDSPQ
jgi:hypothetical protein